MIRGRIISAADQAATRQDRMAHAAWHEAGHAVAAVLAWRAADRRPPTTEPWAVDYVEITSRRPDCWGGLCWCPQLYQTDWNEPQTAAEWRIVFDMTGSVAEAIQFGEWHWRGAMRPLLLERCGAAGDLLDADAMLAELRQGTGRRYGLQRYAVRARRLLRANWPAVEALAHELLAVKRVEGDRVVQIVDRPGRRHAR